MSEEEYVLVITDREELFDKCENMEQLFDKYYLPLLDKHYSKVYQLQQENQELKSELETYNKGCSELRKIIEHKDEKINELKKQLEEYKKELEKADSITQSCIFNGKKESEISYRKCLNMLEDLKEKNQKLRIQVSAIKETFLNQQKEFIEYMNKIIEELECDDVDDEEIKGYLIQRIDTFKEILSKYKSIIGDSNEL